MRVPDVKLVVKVVPMARSRSYIRHLPIQAVKMVNLFGGGSKSREELSVSGLVTSPSPVKS